MTESLYESLAGLARSGGSAALCTVIRERGSVPRHVGSKMLVHADGRIEGTVGGGEMESRVIREALATLASGSPRVARYSLVDLASGDPGVCGGEMEIFIEPVKPRPTLLVVGGGHVGKALVQMGTWLGFRVVLSDDRPEFCTPDAIPGADVYLPVPMRELPQHLTFTDETYVVLATRGMPVDVNGLPELLDQPHAYLGVIGSRRRWTAAARQLEGLGVSEEELARVHAPMGLELNAETPEEIAVSILAEIIMLRRGGTGVPMSKTGLTPALSGTPSPDAVASLRASGEGEGG
jgi:xanthine dehydrogenase accessory factor